MNIDRLKCLIDLHLHLDGALSLENVKELARIQNIELPEEDSELLKLLRVDEGCRDLGEFLEKFDFPCSLLQTSVGIKTALQNLIKELKEQGLMYAEVRFAPQKSTEKGLSIEAVVLATIEGIKNSPKPISLILCGMRERDNRGENLETVRVASKYMGSGVVAVDLAGAEGLFPAQDYTYMFDYAKSLGVPFTVHAGEADGANSVEKALDLGACRIGHGVRSVEDEKVLERIVKEQILLELCPSSNLCTCVFNDISEFPIIKLLESGACVCLNSDDPAIINTNTKKEYKLVCDSFGLDMDCVKALLLNAVNASFANEELKKAMTERINAELDFPEQKLSLYIEQKKTLDTFLANGAITKRQYDKSLGDLRVLMNIPRELY